eukprot:GILK01000759.1.p2 GENE.GILK01000759.1~~GILK01000759.1.p2  ORF type:complete len:123 (+),score=10.01 GILK01000759.1:222-590(+)
MAKSSMDEQSSATSPLSVPKATVPLEVALMTAHGVVDSAEVAVAEDSEVAVVAIGTVAMVAETAVSVAPATVVVADQDAATTTTKPLQQCHAYAHIKLLSAVCNIVSDTIDTKRLLPNQSTQ